MLAVLRQKKVGKNEIYYGFLFKVSYLPKVHVIEKHWSQTARLGNADNSEPSELFKILSKYFYDTLFVNPTSTNSFVAKTNLESSKYSCFCLESLVKVKNHELTDSKWINMWLF